MPENTEETTRTEEESTRSQPPRSEHALDSTKSSSEQEGDRAEHIKFCYRAAGRILRFYRRTDAWDPDVFLAGIAANLAEYPRDVILEVADPAKGIVAKSKFPPQPSEVREACEAIVGPRRRIEQRQASIKKQLAEREALEAPVERRQTWPEVVEEMASRGFGVPKGHSETPMSVRAKGNLTQEQWDDLPNQPTNPLYWRGIRDCVASAAAKETNPGAADFRKIVGEATAAASQTSEGAGHGE